MFIIIEIKIKKCFIRLFHIYYIYETDVSNINCLIVVNEETSITDSIQI